MSHGRAHAQRALDGFWAIAGSVSVRTKLIGIILGLVLVLGLGITLVVRHSLREVALGELEMRAASVAQDLASRSTDLILINNLFALHQLARETQSNHPDVEYVFIVDTAGHVLAHTFGPGFPGGLLEANPLPPGAAFNTRVLATSSGQVWDVAAPIFDGRAGVVRVGFSEAVLQRTVGVVTAELLLATLLVSTAGIAAAIGLTWFITRPILKLGDAARAVGQGDLTQKAPRWANDEIGDLADAFNAMVADLSRAALERQEREQMRAALIERVITAQEDERKRIARDLHDQTSQSLVSLIVQLKLVESAPDDASRSQGLAELREQVRTVLGEVRQMALNLRPNVLDDLGLTQAIHWFADRCHQNGLAIDIHACPEQFDRLPAAKALAAYRVAQEALSNVVKHSHASQARVSLHEQGGWLQLEIADNGRGFAPGQARLPGGGMGLFGMQERVQLLGGQLKIDSVPGHGTRIRAELPLESNEVSQ